ncbi:MAG TPA: ABC transporter permease [Kofleriaceae bacterium]|jgi:simple sugar transport system permease protein
MIAALLTTAFGAQVLRIAIPYVLAALGGTITERAGVVDLAIEAKLLFGAFAAAAVAHATHSPWLGVLGGAGAGAFVAATQVWLALGFGANQIIVGVGLNLLALGGTRFLLQLTYGEGANSPQIAGFSSALVGNPIAWFALLAAIGVPLALGWTRWGLRLRAAGDRPSALVAVGVDPTGVRLGAAVVGGALAGVGGAQLALSVNGFSAGMSGGRGYIALAMVILSGWRPAWAVVACVGVAVAEAGNILLQVSGDAVPRELAPLLPYALTLAVLVVAGGRREPPRALGKQETT